MSNSDLRSVALALDLTVYLKRHTDVFAGAVRFANRRKTWTCVIDDYAENTLKTSPPGKSPYAGVIGRATQTLAQVIQRRKIPLVNVWRSSPVPNLHGVYPDVRAAGEMAARHLVDRGVRRLACIFRGSDPGERELADRFRDVTTEAGCECTMISVGIRFAHTLSTWTKTRSRILDWLYSADHPVGVFTSIDILGRHVAQLANANGLAVPRDVAIVSAHNEPTLCLYPEPSLTSIEYGFDRIGYEAGQLLDQLMNGRKPSQKTILVPPRELVIRASSDFLYSEDEVVSLAMQFISQNSHRPINVDSVARKVNVSRRALEKRFERHTGRSVAAEVRRVRIDHAKRLLAGSDSSIAQIARATGFVTPNQLARVFRRELNITPRDYRAQRQAE